MVTVNINGTARTSTGTSSAKADRKAGKIPCVLYGGGNSLHFTTTSEQVRDIVYTGEFKVANISLDGSSYRCILKEVQFNPVTDEVTHLDFLQLVDGNAVKVEVPIRFEGTSPGVRAGGKFVAKLRSVKIKSKPENLVSEVKASISKLRLGQSIRVRDIATVDGVEIISAAAQPIALISIPRGLKAGAGDDEETGEE